MTARPGRPFPRSFLTRRTATVARTLLGALLTVRGSKGVRTVRIVETEAYVAQDPASHAYRGRTKRNRSMFARPGTLYVYRIHQVVCANIVTRPGQAVLLRAGEPLGALTDSARGPGRLCRALGITLRDDGADAIVGPRIRLRVGPPRTERVWVGPRVGISRAQERPLRFALIGSKHVSAPRPKGTGRFSGALPRRSRGAAHYRRTRRRRTRPSAGGRSVGRSAGR